jgi:hypothetical protein
MERALRDTEEIVNGFLAFPERTQVPLTDLRTDPFRFEAAEPEKAPAEVQQEQARLMRLKAQEAARTAAAQLRVDFVMIGRGGRQGSAMINGHAMRVGESNDGFTLEEVRSQAVIVRQGEFRFVVPIASIGGGTGQAGNAGGGIAPPVSPPASATAVEVPPVPGSQEGNAGK